MLFKGAPLQLGEPPVLLLQRDQLPVWAPGRVRHLLDALGYRGGYRRGDNLLLVYDNPLLVYQRIDLRLHQCRRRSGSALAAARGQLCELRVEVCGLLVEGREPLVESVGLLRRMLGNGAPIEARFRRRRARQEQRAGRNNDSGDCAPHER